MPTRSPTPCKYPACKAMATDLGYCAEHNAAQTKQRNREYDTFVRANNLALARAKAIRDSRQWQKFRAWFRARHPLCCDPFKCRYSIHPMPTQHVHHVQGLAVEPGMAYIESNCRPLCSLCHSRVEALERQGYATAGLMPEMQIIGF